MTGDHYSLTALDRINRLEQHFRAGLDECCALRAALEGSSCPEKNQAEMPVPIAIVAQVFGVSKSAAAKQAKRRGLAVYIGGRIHIYPAALTGFYPNRVVSALPPPPSALAR